MKEQFREIIESPKLSLQSCTCKMSVSKLPTATLNESPQTYHTPSLMYVKLNAPGMRDGVQTYSLPSDLVHLEARGCLLSLDLPEEPQATVRETSQVGVQFMIIFIYN